MQINDVILDLRKDVKQLKQEINIIKQTNGVLEENVASHFLPVLHPSVASFQIGASLYAVGRPVRKRNDEDGQIGTIQSLPLERGASFNRFFGEPAHGPPHVAGGASGPIGGCQDESRTDNPDLDLRHVFDKNNRKTDLI